MENGKLRIENKTEHRIPFSIINFSLSIFQNYVFSKKSKNNLAYHIFAGCPFDGYFYSHPLN